MNIIGAEIWSPCHPQQDKWGPSLVFSVIASKSHNKDPQSSDRRTVSIAKEHTNISVFCAFGSHLTPTGPRAMGSAEGLACAIE
jgi:hypothetical protein